MRACGAVHGGPDECTDSRSSKHGRAADAKDSLSKTDTGGRMNAMLDVKLPKAATLGQGKSKYRHAVRQTADHRVVKDEVEEELKRRGTRMTD